jgi:hypothetical protein
MGSKRHIGCIAAIIAFIAVVSYADAQQQPIFVFRDSAWANTGVQSTPPAAVITSAGVCAQGPNCNSYGEGMNNLNPLTFYPSSHIQTVTVTSAWGSAFDAFASVFTQGGEIDYWVPQLLSNDGLAPSNFFQGSQTSGGTAKLKAATATSVEVLLAPFTFQQTSGGWWVAVGNDGYPPQMTIRVYGTY